VHYYYLVHALEAKDRKKTRGELHHWWQQQEEQQHQHVIGVGEHPMTGVGSILWIARRRRRSSCPCVCASAPNATNYYHYRFVLLLF
jgi:hypothetical protein